MNNNSYLVWDALNGSEEASTRVEACNPGHAAEMYACDDGTGLNDGLYEDGHPVCVRLADTPDAEVQRFRVCVERDPIFTSTPLSPSAAA